MNGFLQNLVRAGSSGLQGYMSASDFMRQQQAQNLQNQQAQIRLKQQQDEYKKQQDYNNRIKQYQDLVTINPNMNQAELNNLQSRIFAPEMLEQQIKSAYNPLQMMKFDQSAERLKLATEAEARKQKSQEMQADKNAFMKDYNNRSLSLREKSYDRGVQEFERTLVEKIRDQDWQESAIERNQLELQKKINPAIQKYKLPGKSLDDVEVRKINEGTAATGNLLALTGDLRDQVSMHGLTRVKGENKARMESTVRAIAVSLNNPMFVNSGVMSPGELENLKEMVGDPTSLFMLSEGEVTARMDQLKKLIQSKYVNSLNSYGVDGKKAYKEIELRSAGFFKKLAKEGITSGEVDITPEEESWIK